MMERTVGFVLQVNQSQLRAFHIKDNVQIQSNAYFTFSLAVTEKITASSTGFPTISSFT